MTYWKGLAPYLAPYFDNVLHDRGVLGRFWVAENGFPNGQSFKTLGEATADVQRQMRPGVKYQLYDEELHEWVWSGGINGN
jgi:hypothetical protein